MNFFYSNLINLFLTDNFWPHVGTAGCIMSCSNADAVRLKAKQHPCPVLLGPMGIGKSSCQDVCMWNLCGTREVAKIDSGKWGVVDIFYLELYW